MEVVEVATRVAEGQLRVRVQRVQLIAAAHCSEPLRLYWHESLSHRVYCQQGVLQRDHSQEAGFVLLCESNLCREGLVLQRDHRPAYVHWDCASVGQPRLGRSSHCGAVVVFAPTWVGLMWRARFTGVLDSEYVDKSVLNQRGSRRG